MRNLKVYLFLLVCFSFNIYSQSKEAKSLNPASSAQIERLRNQLQKGNVSAVLEQFWEKVKKSGTPLIETIPGDKNNVLVTFLWRGNADTQNVVIFSQIGGLNPADNKLALLPDSDVWYRSYIYPKDMRLLYTLSPNDDLTPLNAPNLNWQKRFANIQPDPLNPKRFPQAGSAAKINIQSVMELPDAPRQVWITPKAGTAKGHVEKKTITSRILNNERNVWIYLPPKYQAKNKSYPLVVTFDGTEYLDLVPTPTILDNLIASGQIPPVIAIFIDNPSPASREAELPCNNFFADFLARELMPWVRQNYPVTTDPSQTVISGSSYGGLAATCVAMNYPQMFGNVLAQSSSYYWKPENETEYEWLKKQFSTKPKLPLKFFLTIGLLETLPKPGRTNQLEVNRRFRDALRAKGYETVYTEFNGAHEYVDWQGTLAEGLITLLGKRI